MAEGNINVPQGVSQRIYTLGGAEGLGINIANNVGGQLYILINTRGDIILLSFATDGSTFWEVTTPTIIKNHNGEIVTAISPNHKLIYVGIKFGNVYGTQGWNVYGVQDYPFYLTREAMPS